MGCNYRKNVLYLIYNMAIVTKFEHKITQQSHENLFHLDKGVSSVISSKVVFDFDGQIITPFEIASNSIVHVGGNSGGVISYTDSIVAKRDIGLWIEFVQKEMNPPEIPLLKTKSETVAEDGKSIKIEFSIFNPNLTVLTDAIWTKSNDSFLTSARPTTTISWGDFKHWQSYLDYALKLIALKR